ncbi:MAG: Crp/Fnr family transcriptional regulator [Pseudomonadota bacterium]|nr:Crp/Fnr family transcriptional regulator [Burkholderiales bacterium]MDQ3196490.1 Crp/Fnr family transcriptional regulator [Pseudomonadota bacterium]
MPDSKPPQSPSNHLLAALPENVFRRLEPSLEPVDFKLGDVIYEPGAKLQHVYFPVTCIISLLYTMENGVSAEIGVVGNEGLVGLALYMGGDTMPNRAIIQSAGSALRLPAKALQDEFKRGGEMQIALLRFTQALITQMSQTAVCNQLHTLDEQLCRWLLLSHDRLQNDELVMTQELMANMLGVRREGVTLAAGRLQSAGLIRYNRGRVNINNRTGLEEAVCECYRVVKLEYERLLNDQRVLA